MLKYSEYVGNRDASIIQSSSIQNLGIRNYECPNFSYQLETENAYDDHGILLWFLFFGGGGGGIINKSL